MNFAKCAAWVAIGTMLSAVCATARPVTTTGDTNLRKASGTDSEKLALIPKGTTVDVGTCTNGWCEVTWNGQDGYAISRNLGMASAVPRALRAPTAAAPVNPVAPASSGSAVPSAAYSGPHLGLRYDGPYDERIVVGPSGLVAGTDPDPNIRAYLRRDGGGASTTSGGLGN